MPNDKHRHKLKCVVKGCGTVIGNDDTILLVNGKIVGRRLIHIPIDTVPGRRAVRSYAFFMERYGNTDNSDALYEALSCEQCGSRQTDMKGVIKQCEVCGWNISEMNADD